MLVTVNHRWFLRIISTWQFYLKILQWNHMHFEQSHDLVSDWEHQLKRTIEVTWSNSESSDFITRYQSSLFYAMSVELVDWWKFVHIAHTLPAWYVSISNRFFRLLRTLTNEILNWLCNECLWKLTIPPFVYFLFVQSHDLYSYILFEWLTFIGMPQN